MLFPFFIVVHLSSEIEKLASGEEEPPFIESVGKLFGTPGFAFPLAAFIMSISITNIVGVSKKSYIQHNNKCTVKKNFHLIYVHENCIFQAFIDEVMKRGGVTDQFGIDLAGAGFEFGILLGGIIIGGYVDKTKEYKNVTKACILATMFFLIPLGLTEHAIGQEPILLVLALLGLGMTAGPIQPINAELAVDVTYPSDETAVESVQQIGGNLVSALLVPLAEIGARQDYELFASSPALESDIRGDVIMLVTMAIATYVFFNNFDAPLKRTLADLENGNEEEGGAVIDVTAGLANGVGNATQKGSSLIGKR